LNESKVKVENSSIVKTKGKPVLIDQGGEEQAVVGGKKRIKKGAGAGGADKEERGNGLGRKCKKKKDGGNGVSGALLGGKGKN